VAAESEEWEVDAEGEMVVMIAASARTVGISAGMTLPVGVAVVEKNVLMELSVSTAGSQVCINPGAIRLTVSR
jgi:hypothetical protein